MISVKEFSDLINWYGKDFRINFQKLIHEPIGFYNIGLKIVEIKMDDYENLCTFILEETYDEEEYMDHKIEDIRELCDKSYEYLRIEFKLKIRFGTIFDTIPLSVSSGDVSWSDMVRTINFVEEGYEALF